MILKRYLKDNYAIVAMWALLFLMIWMQVVPQTKSVIEATLFVLFFVGFSFPFVKFLSENLLQKALKQKKITLFTLQFLLFSIFIGIIFVGCLYLFSFLEASSIFPQSGYFDMNVPLSMFLVPMSVGMVMNACICGIRFFQENNNLKKVLIEYQLRTLQHQVTPHFMFNVLNHIHILMQTDVSLASDLLIKYSEILRYQLYNGEKESVQLEQDIRFLKDFIHVEEIRWGDKISIKCSWNIEDPKKEIPALLFITFIENAFKHVPKSDFEKGHIIIEFEQRGSTLRLHIENSKSAFSKTKEDTGGLGLKNIKERLEILFFEQHQLVIEETENNYRTKLMINI